MLVIQPRAKKKQECRGGIALKVYSVGGQFSLKYLVLMKAP